jgi:hypothetical protein
MQTFLFSLFLLLSLQGCSVKPYVPSKSEELRLAIKLHHLSSQASQEEVATISHHIYKTIAKLTQQFALTSPPVYHNFLVNVGLKEEGLCYHWSDALYVEMQKSDSPSFSFHLVGANIGSYWREHNAVVVTAKGANLKEGLILDAWRNSGKLFVIALQQDHYHWVHRKQRCLALKR